MEVGWPCGAPDGWEVDNLDVGLAASAWSSCTRKASRSLGRRFGELYARQGALGAVGERHREMVRIGGPVCGNRVRTAG